jgi:hypothetical protein
VKQFQITKERGQLSDGATQAVGGFAKLEGWAAENPKTAIAAGVGTAIAGRLLWKKMLGGGGGGGGGLESVIKGAGAGGMPVTVTNWPVGLGGSMKPSERARSLPGRPDVDSTSAPVKGTGSKVLGAAGKAFSVLGSGAMGWEMGTLLNDYAINPLANMAGGGKGDTLGTLIYDLLHKNQESTEKQNAQLASALQKLAERPMEVHLDGQVIADSVNRTNGRSAGRQ